MRNFRVDEDLSPIAIPLGEKGNEVVIGAHGESPQIASIGVRHDRQELCIPGHVSRLVLKPTSASDGVEMQRVLLYEPDVFKPLDVGIDNELNFVFLCRKEEGFQIAEIVDDGIRHGVDGLEDVFPCLRGFLNVDLWYGAKSLGGGLGKRKHGFEDRGYERQDWFVNAEVAGSCCADDYICIISTENGRQRDRDELGLYSGGLRG